jgi:hypothetical protein
VISIGSAAPLVLGLRRIGRGTLVVLAVALPFERIDPIARVGPLALSSVEIFIYAVVALWAAARAAAFVGARAPGAVAVGVPAGAPDGTAAPWWRRAPEAYYAVAIWSLVLIASALCAPATRPAAIKFALRSLGGVALFLACADLIDSPRAARRVAAALAAGALAAAILMVAEVHVAAVAPLLRPFHATSFRAYGLLRASGPFQFPNIAAMYEEAAMPLLLATGAHLAAAAGPRGRLYIGATLLAGLAVIYALVLSVSRAGIFTGLTVLLAIALFAGGGTPLRRLGVGLTVLVAATAAVALAVSPLLSLRLRFWNDRGWYRSSIERIAPPRPLRLPLGAPTRMPMTVHNLGYVTWFSSGSQPTHLSYHWYNRDTGQIEIFDGVRTPLPHDVAPGGSATLAALVWPPARPGRFVLQWDLVLEGISWFSSHGDAGLREPIDVVAGKGGGAGVGAVRAMAAPDRAAAMAGVDAVEAASAVDLSRRDLWRAGFAAFRTRPILGIGPDNFRRAYGRFLGLPRADDRLHANNLYVETLANLGLAGLLALGGVVVALARAARTAAASPRDRTLAIALGAGLGAYLVHGALDYFLEFTPTYGLMWLLAGLLVALSGRAGAAAPRTEGVARP